MSLVHGPLSDAFGRTRVILSALLAFALAALGWALSPSVGWLTTFRVVQGMSAGVGTVVGRAIIRDRFEGAAATKLLALVSMIFSLSPALAPVFGWMDGHAVHVASHLPDAARLCRCDADALRAQPAGNPAAGCTPPVRNRFLSAAV
jgi:MFS family permease